MISFCDNDYLGLSSHPRVIAAAVEATQTYGPERALPVSSLATIR